MNYVYIYERGGSTSGGNAGGGNNNNRGGAGLGGESMKACDYFIGGGLYNKWIQMGGEKGVLGCAIMNEADAGKSPQGTTGRYAEFRGGLIVWHRVGPYRGTSFAVDGCFFNIYKSVGRTGSWLGFPIGDAFNITGGSRQDFEGGYMQWSSQTGRCQAYKK